MTESDDFKGAGEIFNKSMKDALSKVDAIAEEARKAHEKAIDLQISAHQELQRIQNEAKSLTEEYVEKNRKEIVEEIRNDELLKITKRMILDGHLPPDIYRWLEIPQKMLASAWFDLGYEPIGQHVANVRYNDKGRSGEVIFYRDDVVLRFYYEFGAAPVLAIIEVPAASEWTVKTGLPIEERMPILEFTAKRIIRDQASGYQYEITDTAILIRA